MDHPASLRTAVSATLHCLTGCAIGEVLGLVLATAWGWGDAASMVLSIGLAFLVGYSLTMLPLLRADLELRQALPVALAADTVSIATMETIDSAIVLLVPGAMAAGLADGLFWGSLAVALFAAFWVAVPVNLWLIRRGKGHAVLHGHH
jgi:presenilin-like A22 family membrane protease